MAWESDFCLKIPVSSCASGKCKTKESTTSGLSSLAISFQITFLRIEATRTQVTQQVPRVAHPLLMQSPEITARNYSGTPLIRSPRGQKNLAVLMGDRINERFFFYKKMYVTNTTWSYPLLTWFNQKSQRVFSYRLSGDLGTPWFK